MTSSPIDREDMPQRMMGQSADQGQARIIDDDAVERMEAGYCACGLDPCTCNDDDEGAAAIARDIIPDPVVDDLEDDGR